MDIIASIVLYCTDRELLTKAIGSFLDTNLVVKLYLIDNSPTPVLKDIVADPRIEYIFNDANLGFGKAHNIALQKSQGFAPYHLVLNPDVMFPAGTLEALHAYMEQDIKVGLVMPKIFDARGELQYLCKRLPSPVDLIQRRFISEGLKPYLFKERMARYAMLDKDYNQVFEAPFLSGCFMLLRSEAIALSGGFDERFFMYMEDVDLSRRIHRHFKTMYYPHVHIFHGNARESYQFGKFLWVHIKSAIQYFNKWGWFFDAERREVNRHL